MSNVHAVLSNIIKKIITRDCDITDETDLISDLCMSSIDFIKLIIGIEEQFKIEIPYQHLNIDKNRKFSSLKKLVMNTMNMNDNSEV